MTDPLVVPTWWLVAAAFAQAVLLFVNAVFVWRYLNETERIRKANEAQLEAQIRPAVVLRMHRKAESVVFENVGNGAAVNLCLARVDVGAPVNWSQTSNFQSSVNGAYLEPGVNGEEWGEGALSKFIVANQALQVGYESLSGRTYVTVVDFDGTGRPMRARFYMKP